MHTRIKYTKTQGKLVSSSIFVLTDYVNIVVDIRAIKYTVLSSKGLKVKSGSARTVQECQRKARKDVIDMGARFFDEIRTRKDEI